MSEFGHLLRHWRNAKRFSQLELALEADVSARHISFLETGRSNPSRSMIMTLSTILDVPLAERNALMQSAGFAQQYSRLDLDAAEMKPVLDALDFILTKHDPYPAGVFDADWNLLMGNASHQKLFGLLKHQTPNFPDTNNVVEMLFHPNGVKPYLRNWEEVASLMLQRLHRERLVYQQRQSDLLDRILAMEGIPENWKSFHPAQASHPMVSLELELDGFRLSMFSALSSFGTAIDVTANELVLEQYFPTDQVSADFLKSL